MSYDPDWKEKTINKVIDERDTYRDLCAELFSALQDCKTDLFFKHENQHGAEKAYNHPSVEKARNAITKAKAILGESQ